mmetsp:Transcript_230/g.690  ORF Transcript_230/g.690 Transcript_230/m.690 type:complete len:189 (-) Transcript_230:77-643(-)
MGNSVTCVCCKTSDDAGFPSVVARQEDRVARGSTCDSDVAGNGTISRGNTSIDISPFSAHSNDWLRQAHSSFETGASHMSGLSVVQTPGVKNPKLALRFWDPQEREAHHVEFNRRPIGIDFASGLPFRVKAVVAHSQADFAGVREGMVLSTVNDISVDGKDMAEVKELVRASAQLLPLKEMEEEGDEQ